MAEFNGSAAPVAPAPPPASEPARRTLDQAGYDRLPLSEQGRWVASRDENYNSQFVERLDRDGGDQPRTSSGEVRVDGDKIRFGEITASEQELRELLIEKGASDARKASLPANPGEYRAELPKDFKPPPGSQFVIDAASPALEDLRRFAHSNGWTQEQFSGALSIYAAERVSEQARLDAARANEVQKLGSNGAMRITALQQFFTGLLGSEDAKAIGSMIVTERIVRALERTMGRFVSQNSGSYSRAHSEPPDQGRVTDEQWNSMGPAERLNYARSHDQGRFR